MAKVLLAPSRMSMLPAGGRRLRRPRAGGHEGGVATNEPVAMLHAVVVAGIAAHGRDKGGTAYRGGRGGNRGPRPIHAATRLVVGGGPVGLSPSNRIVRRIGNDSRTVVEGLAVAVVRGANEGRHNRGRRRRIAVAEAGNCVRARSADAVAERHVLVEGEPSRFGRIMVIQLLPVVDVARVVLRFPGCADGAGDQIRRVVAAATG